MEITNHISVYLPDCFLRIIQKGEQHAETWRRFPYNGNFYLSEGITSALAFFGPVSVPVDQRSAASL